MHDSERLLLENQLCFALHSTSLAMTQLYKEHLEAIGLTYTQYTVMLILWEKDNLTLKDIADRLRQKSGSLTPVIKRMENEGLVRRCRGIEDDRSLSIQLTDKGHKLREQGLEVNRCVSEASGSGMSYDDMRELKDKLIRIREIISKK